VGYRPLRRRGDDQEAHQTYQPQLSRSVCRSLFRPFHPSDHGPGPRRVIRSRQSSNSTKEESATRSVSAFRQVCASRPQACVARWTPIADHAVDGDCGAAVVASRNLSAYGRAEAERCATTWSSWRREDTARQVSSRSRSTRISSRESGSVPLMVTGTRIAVLVSLGAEYRIWHVGRVGENTTRDI
jgi:hypothetical protein